MPRRAVAFETFYDADFASVCRSLTVALHDPLLAEDAAQEAFTRAYVHWRRVARMEHPAAWVYVVAVRVAFKRRAARAGVTDPVHAADFADSIVDRETLRAAIEELPERQRLAIVLRYHADLPLADIATAMGCALGTVKSTLHSALARLEVNLTDDMEVRPDARKDDVRSALDRLADGAPDPSGNVRGAVMAGRRRLARRRMLASGAVVLVIAVGAVGAATRADDVCPGLVVSTPTDAPTTTPSSDVPAVVQPTTSSIIFTSATEGWVCANPILHTANGGTTWQQVPYDAFLSDHAGRVCGSVRGADLWVVVGARAVHELLVQGGSDLGVDVDLPKLPPGGTVTQITFADIEHGWVLARTPGDGPGHGFLYRSVESGIRFKLVSRDVPVNGVQFANATEGWGIGDGQLEHSTDGGAHWKVVTLPVGRQVLTSVTLHGSTIVVAGAAQTGAVAGDPPFFVVSHDDGRSWKVVEGPAQLRVSDFARYFFVATDAAHWRVAYNGLLYSTDDGGATWRETRLPPALAQLSSLQFPTPEIGWAIAGTAVSKTTDGGATWRAVDSTPVANWRTGLADVPTGCPSRAVTPAPINAASRSAATQAARDFVLRTRGWTGEVVEPAYPVTAPSGEFGDVFSFNVPKFCGRAVADASYGIEMDNEMITQDNSRVTALVVGHFADGWHVWGWYK